MPRIGKYIGHKPTISTSSAVGVWDLIDQNVNSREGSWPGILQIYDAYPANFTKDNSDGSVSVTTPQSTSVQLIIVTAVDINSISVTDFTLLYKSHPSGEYGICVFYRESPPASSSISWSGGPYSENLAYYEIKDSPPVSSWTTETIIGNSSLTDTIESSTNDLIIGCMSKQDTNDSDHIGSAVGWTTFNKAYNPSGKGWTDLALGAYTSTSDGTSPSLGFSTSQGSSRSAMMLINIPYRA